MTTPNKEITKDPTLEEMATWSKCRLAGRAILLGLVCADRKTKQDGSWQWADRELTKMVPLINERFG